MKDKKIIVVLGMHRSGTSAITRGLQVLNIDLGQNLMPPVPDINDKGFFEDMDVNAINVELMHIFKHDWHTLASIPVEEFLSEKIQPLRNRAINLLRLRLQDVDWFAFKDPRTCRLLTFWQSVFTELQFDVCYVIVLRNPLSVVASLERVYYMPSEKGYYLWLEHMLASVALTQETSRVLVDYDLFLENIEEQLLRIAKVLNIDTRLDLSRLAEFENNYIERDLRHTTFCTEDVCKDPTIPTSVNSAISVLSDVATDKLSLDSEKVRTILNLDSEKVARIIGHFSEQMGGITRALNNILHLENTVADKHKNFSERKYKVEVFEETINAQASQILDLTTELTAQTNKINTLLETLSTQTSQLLEQEQQINTLQKIPAEKDVQIDTLNEILLSKDHQLKSLRDIVHQKNVLMEKKNTTAVQLNYRLKKIYSSIVWYFLGPVRAINNLIIQITQTVKVDLLPVHQLQNNKKIWLATDSDPQFLLIAEQDWLDLAGGYLLKVNSLSEKPMNAQIFFDYGQGFEPDRTIDFQLNGNGDQELSLSVPLNCHAIRLDPCDMKTEFKLSVHGLKKLKNTETISSGNSKEQPEA